MEERAEQVDWSNIFRQVKIKDLVIVTINLHNNINWVMNEVALWITIKADPDYIGSCATEDLKAETNKKNNEHRKPNCYGWRQKTKQTKMGENRGN